MASICSSIENNLEIHSRAGPCQLCSLPSGVGPAGLVLALWLPTGSLSCSSMTICPWFTWPSAPCSQGHTLKFLPTEGINCLAPTGQVAIFQTPEAPQSRWPCLSLGGRAEHQRRERSYLWRWDNVALRTWMQLTTVGSAHGQGPLQILSVGMEATGGGSSSMPREQEFHAVLVSRRYQRDSGQGSRSFGF